MILLVQAGGQFVAISQAGSPIQLQSPSGQVISAAPNQLVQVNQQTGQQMIQVQIPFDHATVYIIKH